MAKKTTFNNPDSQEREYTRLLVRYSKQLQRDINRVLLPHLGDIALQYNVEARLDAWTDTLDGLIAELVALATAGASSVVTKLSGQFSAISKFNEGQFKMVVKANTGLALPPVMPGAPSSSLLGVNVFRSEPFLAPLAEGWVSENTALIKSLPTRLHPELEGIVRRGIMNGQSIGSLKNQIKARYGVTDHRAKLIAQDQTLKLNAGLTRYRLQSVGVEQYIWRTVQDSRVRPEHADRNGETYSWEAGAGGEHPGQPVRCRCRAEAIWDDEEETAPVPKRETTIPKPDITRMSDGSAIVKHNGEFYKFNKYEFKDFESEGDEVFKRIPKEYLTKMKVDKRLVGSNSFIALSEKELDIHGIKSNELIKDYTNYGFNGVNRELRGFQLPQTDLFKELESAFSTEKLSTSPVVWRGVDTVAPFKVGQVIYEPAYLSTSLDKTVGEQFAKGGTLFRIKNAEGLYINNNSEKELLIRRGSKLKIQSIQNGDGYTLVEAVLSLT